MHFGSFTNFLPLFFFLITTSCIISRVWKNQYFPYFLCSSSVCVPPISLQDSNYVLRIDKQPFYDDFYWMQIQSL